MVLLGILQYLMPVSFDNPARVNRAAVQDFSSAFFLPGPFQISIAAFVWSFRALLTMMWAGYALLLFGRESTETMRRWHVWLPVATCVFAALLWPPTLSTDVYSYVAWGRMSVLHHWSPYAATLADLAATGDAAAGLNPVPAPSNHGPVWLLLTTGIVWLLQQSSTVWQVIALKVVAGFGLLLAAFSGREISRVLGTDRPQHTFLAIALNPLLLIEGPANGHNDVLMMGLMLAGVSAHLRGRLRLGYLLLGCSAGIKFVTASVVPWILAHDLRAAKSNRAVVVGAALPALLLFALPVASSYLLVGPGHGMLNGVRSVYERRVEAIEAGSAANRSSQDAASTSRSTRLAGVITRLALLSTLYFVLTMTIWNAGSAAAVLSAWAWFAIGASWIAMPVVFAWYLAWPVAASAPLPAAPRRAVFVASNVIGAVLLYAYTITVST
jgi:alpha-1,6-mannosyltransferase